MQEVGKAYVTLLPSATGFSKAVEGEIGGAYEKAEQQGKGFFSRLAGFAKGVGVAMGAALSVVGALALTGGISRALNIEDAQAKLKGLGHDTATVTQIMQDALASVKGTSFGLDSAATMAASAVAAGIKPGRELERYLRLTADAATIAGGSMDDLGRVMNNVTTLGAAYNDSLQILAQKGLPIYQWLSEEMGVSTSAVKDLASEGKISAETFRKAIEDNIAGAALAAGDTTRGAFANMKSSLSRLGVAFLGDGLSGAKKFFGEMTVFFDGLTSRVGPMVKHVQLKLGSMFNIDGLGEKLLGKFDQIVEYFSSGKGSEFISTLTPIIPIVGAISGALGGVFSDALTDLFDALAPVLPLLSGALVDAIKDLAPSFVELVKAIVPLIPELVALAVAALPLLVDALGAVVDLVTSEEGQSVIAWLVDFIKLLSTPTSDALKDYSDWLRDLSPLLGGFADMMDEFAGLFEADGIGGLIDNIGTKVSEMWTSITAPGAAVVSTVTSTWASLTEFFAGLWATVTQLFVDTWTNIGLFLGDALRIVFGILTGNTALIEEGATRSAQRMGQIFSDAWNGIVAAAGSAWASVTAAIGSGIATAVATVAALPGRIKTALSDAANWLVPTGRNIIQGLINGVQGMIGSAVSAVKNVGGSMLEGIQSFLGIKSPSRVFRDQVGKWIPEGLIAGIELGQPAVDATIQHMVSVPKITSIDGVAFAARSTAGSDNGNVYIDTIVAPDQDPRVSGRIMGREFAKQIAG